MPSLQRYNELNRGCFLGIRTSVLKFFETILATSSSEFSTDPSCLLPLEKVEHSGSKEYQVVKVV
jgi:hypothetical protein